MVQGGGLLVIPKNAIQFFNLLVELVGGLHGADDFLLRGGRHGALHRWSSRTRCLMILLPHGCGWCRVGGGKILLCANVLDREVKIQHDEKWDGIILRSWYIFKAKKVVFSFLFVYSQDKSMEVQYI